MRAPGLVRPVLSSLKRDEDLTIADLAHLGVDDLASKVLVSGVLAELQDDLGHVHCALMVRNHAEHEGRVGIGIGDALHHGAVHAVH